MNENQQALALFIGLTVVLFLMGAAFNLRGPASQSGD
jgi:hypothetical protein